MLHQPVPRSRRAFLRTLAAGSAAALAGAGLWLPTTTSAAPAPGARHAVERRRAQSGDIPLEIPSDVTDDEDWVVVNLTEQAAVAMHGVEPVRVALATTGKEGWDTPEGEFRIVRRVANETMTSASLNITDPDDQYVLKDVLYTQYFTWVGHALHLNYWRPDSVFGAERTSHGCVGLRLADAEFLWRHLALGSRVVVHA